MKTRFNKILVALAALFVMASCSDMFNEDDLKNNPNNPNEDQITITPLTTGTLVGLAQLHEDTDVRIAYIWSGQLAGQSRQHQGFGNYTVAASTFAWGNTYNCLKNARLINKKATVENNKLAIGMSQVIEAMVMMKVTSLWGDAPYSEALDDVNHPTPKYDAQLDLYNTLVALIDTAHDNLLSGVGSITGDFLYGGSATKWAKAAKTLQARMYLHLKKYDKAIAAATEGITDPSDDMLVPHGGTQAVDLNLNFDFFDLARPGDTSFDAPAYLPVFMTTNINTGTPLADRAIRNAKTDETGMYFHFFSYGAESSNGRDPNTIDGMFAGDAPHPMLTFYENQLIFAEASARLDNFNDALDALNGVRDLLASGYINGLHTNYSTISKSGTITASDASDVIVGGTSGDDETAFTEELQVGSVIYNSDGDEIGTVASITDDSHLTLESNAAVNVAGDGFGERGLLYLPYDAADFDPDGVANPSALGRDAKTALLYEIASEKYILLLAQYESFSEVRRLKAASPAVDLGVPLVNGTRYPERFIYPQNEINTNPNVPKINGSVPDPFVKLPIFE